MGWQSTLVHEMVHLWQEDYGNLFSSRYHNRQWAQKMEEIGLMPSSTGLPDGKKTGNRMTHYIIHGGPFVEAFHRLGLVERQIKFVPASTITENKTVKKRPLKTRYKCPCGNYVWGKMGLSVVCIKCKKRYKPEQSKHIASTN